MPSNERPEPYTHQGDLFRFGFTQCDGCGTIVHQDDAVRAVYYDHTEFQQTDDYCSEDCKQQAYLRRLNSAGM